MLARAKTYMLILLRLASSNLFGRRHALESIRSPHRDVQVGDHIYIYIYIYMVVDLKVLVSSVYDDDPEHIKISFGESFFSSWRK